MPQFSGLSSVHPNERQPMEPNRDRASSTVQQDSKPLKIAAPKEAGEQLAASESKQSTASGLLGLIDCRAHQTQAAAFAGGFLIGLGILAVIAASTNPIGWAALAVGAFLFIGAVAFEVKSGDFWNVPALIGFAIAGVFAGIAVFEALPFSALAYPVIGSTIGGAFFFGKPIYDLQHQEDLKYQKWQYLDRSETPASEPPTLAQQVVDEQTLPDATAASNLIEQPSSLDGSFHVIEGSTAAFSIPLWPGSSTDSASAQAVVDEQTRAAASDSNDILGSNQETRPFKYGNVKYNLLPPSSSSSNASPTHQSTSASPDASENRVIWV